MASTLRRYVGRAALVMSTAASPTWAACASSPRPVPVSAYTMTPLEEAAAIERAKRSPIAQPRQRPRYPEKAPPPLAAGETPRPSPFLARFAEASQAARTQPDAEDLDFGASYAPPGYPGYFDAPDYGWGVGVNVWPGYYGFGWRQPWYRPFGYRAWPHLHYGPAAAFGAHYHGDYQLRAPSWGGAGFGGHYDSGHGRATIHAHH